MSRFVHVVAGVQGSARGPLAANMAGQEALPRIDHIIIGAQDLKAAVDHFYNEYGLAAYHGGKHQVGTEFTLCRTADSLALCAKYYDMQAVSRCETGIQAQSAVNCRICHHSVGRLGHRELHYPPGCGLHRDCSGVGP